MGEERFEFHQLPRDVESEVQTQARETVELFEKWCPEHIHYDLYGSNNVLLNVGV